MISQSNHLNRMLVRFASGLLLCAAIAGSVESAFAQSSGAVSVTVRSVAGGGVLDVAFRDGRTARLRLAGIHVADCMSSRASDRLDGLARGRVDFLELDDQSGDIAGQLSGYVWVDGVMLNTLLVSEGYAVPRPSVTGSPYDEDLYAAAERASWSGLGLWSSCPP